MAKRNGLKAAVGMSERYHKTEQETPCSEGKKPGRCLLDPRTTAGLTPGPPSSIGKEPAEFTTGQPS